MYYTMYPNNLGSAYLRGVWWNGGSFSALMLDYAASGNACGSTSLSTSTFVSLPKAVTCPTTTRAFITPARAGTLRMAQYAP